MQGEIRPGYKQTEVGVIPEDWRALRLGSGISLLSGHHVLARYCNSTSGTPYITGPSDFSAGKIKHTKFTTKPTALCAEDDILITVKGSGAGEMVVSDAEYCISRQLMAIRPLEWSGLYVFYSLRQNSAAISAASTGLIPGLSRIDVTEQLLPVPPLREQRAIAAALSDADALIAALEGMIAKKRDLKQAAMQHLLSGKTRLPGFAGEWEVKRIGEVTSIQRGASPRPIDSPIWFDEFSRIGWVRISDVSKSNMFLTSTTQRLSLLGIARSRSVELGSLIMSIAATVGRPAITQIECCIHDGFVVFSNLKMDKVFLYFVLRDIEPKWSKQGQTGSQMNLNSAMIERTEILLPPSLAEQTAIAEVLSDMDADLAALEAQAAKARAVKQGMMQELLTGRVRLV
jgi:type I restriction enzyme S subunit